MHPIAGLPEGQVFTKALASMLSPARRFGGALVFFEESLGEAVRQRCDGQAGVRADGPRHDGPIGDVESRIVENLAVRAHDALPFVPPHRAAAQRVHGNDPTEVPDGIILEVGSYLARHHSRRVAKAVEERPRLELAPVNVQFAPAKGHFAVRNITSHPDHRKNAGGELGLAEQLRDLRAEITLGLSPEPTSDQVARRKTPLPQRPWSVEHLQDPGEVLGETGVFEVEAPALFTIQLVADPDGASDDRAVAGVDDARHPRSTALFGGLDGEREQIAVAAEARAETPAEMREGTSVLQQQECGTQAPGRKDQAVSGDGMEGQAGGIRLVPLPLWIVVDVVDRVPSTIAGLERLDLATCPQVRVVLLLGSRQVGVVEGVLAAIVAAEVALAGEAAGVTRPAVKVGMLLTDRFAWHRRLVFVGEGNGEIGQERL